jgi:hypothetical protein
MAVNPDNGWLCPAMTAPCRGPTFRCCKIGCARLMMPWSERMQFRAELVTSVPC